MYSIDSYRGNNINCDLFIYELMRSKGIDIHHPANEEAMALFVEKVTEALSRFVGEQNTEYTREAIKSTIYYVLDDFENQGLFYKGFKENI